MASNGYAAPQAGFLETYFTDPECVINDIFLADSQEQWVKCSLQKAKIKFVGGLIALVVILLIILIIMFAVGTGGFGKGLTVFIGLLVGGAMYLGYHMAGKRAQREWIYKEEWMEKQGLTKDEIDRIKKDDPLKYAKLMNEMRRTSSWGSPIGGPHQQQKGNGFKTGVGVGVGAVAASKALNLLINGRGEEDYSGGCDENGCDCCGCDGNCDGDCCDSCNKRVELGDDIEEPSED